MLKLAMIYGAGQGEKNSGTHNIADSLAVAHSWQHTLLEIRFYFTRRSSSHFAHHSPVCTFHHTTKGSMECKVVKGLPIIDINDPFLVLEKGILATIQIR